MQWVVAPRTRGQIANLLPSLHDETNSHIMVFMGHAKQLKLPVLVVHLQNILQGNACHFSVGLDHAETKLLFDDGLSRSATY